MLKQTLRGTIAVGVVVLVVALGAHVGERDSNTLGTESTRGLFSLAVPAFAQDASANQFPNNEVGICAYIKLNQTIDLSRAAAVFTGIEAQEETYIIGTVELPSQLENMWPHMYISRDGWMMAYYPRTEPTSRLFQWVGYQGGAIGTTTLRDALIRASQQIGVSTATVNSSLAYYHFQFPTATKMLIAVDRTSGSDSFTYTIPSGLGVHEASWSHYAANLGTYRETKMTVDSEQQFSASGGGARMGCGSLGLQFTSPDTPHPVGIVCGDNWAGTAILFLYQ